MVGKLVARGQRTDVNDDVCHTLQVLPFEDVDDVAPADHRAVRSEDLDLDLLAVECSKESLRVGSCLIPLTLRWIGPGFPDEQRAYGLGDLAEPGGDHTGPGIEAGACYQENIPISAREIVVQKPVHIFATVGDTRIPAAFVTHVSLR